MSDHDSLIDPEAEAILLEVAKDPNSVLLKAERPKKLSRVVAQGGDLLVTHKTGLTSAEKKLLDVYREEAAYLLRLAYFESWIEAGVDHTGGKALAMSTAIDSDLESSRFTERLWAAYTDANPVPPALRDSFARGMELVGQTPPNWMALAQSSLHLAPSRSGESYVAMEMFVSGNLSSADKAYARLLQNPLGNDQAADFLTTHGVIQLDIGDREEGLRSYRWATIRDPYSASAAFSNLWGTAHYGSDEEFRQAVEHMNEMPVQMSCIGRLVSTIREQRRLGRRAAVKLDARRVLSVVDRAGEMTALVLEELLRCEDD